MPLHIGLLCMRSFVTQRYEHQIIQCTQLKEMSSVIKVWKSKYEYL